MSLRVCVLASGSSGNCTYIASPRSALLIDAGLSLRAIAARLGRIGVSLTGIDAVCVSHEHGDHVSGLGLLHRRYGMPLHASPGTMAALRERDGLSDQAFRTEPDFRVGDLAVRTFPVSHDSAEPMGFVVSDGTTSVGIATDLGKATPTVMEHLGRCSTVILEANHDKEMLLASGRPRWLKERILGPWGHLSNEDSGAILAQIAGPDLRWAFLAHLSAECNTPGKARLATAVALDAAGQGHVTLALTHPDRNSEVWESGQANA